MTPPFPTHPSSDHITDTTYFLFENEYNGVPLLPTSVSAPMAAYAEHLFPTLLVLGLATRLSALALLGMTLVIQFFVYPDAWWSVHLLRSEEHTSALQSLMRSSYAVFCLKKK